MTDNTTPLFFSEEELDEPFFAQDDEDKLTLFRSNEESNVSLNDYEMEEREQCDSCCHLSSMMGDLETNDSNSILGRMTTEEENEDIEFLEQEGLLFVFDSFMKDDEVVETAAFDPFKIAYDDFFLRNEEEK